MNSQPPISDFGIVRRMVIAAFESGATTSAGSGIFNDLESKLPPMERRKIPKFHEDENPWNRKVNAKPTRRSGKSKPPMGEHDFAASNMRRRVGRLSREDFAFLSYFYDASTIKNKPWAFVRVWVNYSVTLKGKNTQTRETCAQMLQILLECYRLQILQNRDFPARPWIEFELTQAQWKRTFNSLWNGMKNEIIQVDESILEHLK